MMEQSEKDLEVGTFTKMNCTASELRAHHVDARPADAAADAAVVQEDARAPEAVLHRDHGVPVPRSADAYAAI